MNRELELGELVVLAVSVVLWAELVAWLAADQWGPLGARAVGAFLGFELWGIWLDWRDPPRKPPGASSAGPRNNGAGPRHRRGPGGRSTRLRGS